MSEQKVNNLRHTASHLLAAAVLDLYPKTKHTIGPVIENGFYYDFEFDQPISDKDLAKIEKRMRQLLLKWGELKGREVSEKEAQEIYQDNSYKLELIDELIKQKEKITVYESGGFVDLCRGGHLEKPKQELKHFKLLSVAGAYWRGDEKNKMLTRIYGTAFENEKELMDYLEQIQLAKARDHKKLGKDLGLFTFSQLVGPGLPLWTPKGTLIRNLLDDYVWQLRCEKGYQKVAIPHITKKDLYVVSGHWDKFKNDLFKITTREGHVFAMKPMNCPHHTQIYNSQQRSYRDLPQRYAETTMVYRDEQTGELNGLSRVRCITQDDAHVFCRENQLKQECLKIWEIIERFYKATGFPQLKVRLSFHDPKKMQNYLGEEANWQKWEQELESWVKERGVDYQVAIGEAAFYGPKIDFIAKDSLQREWQVATIQADRNMPKSFELACINENGGHEPIVMIHAAIMGSIERFVSILIEHYAGAFPVWLSPVQVVVVPVSNKFIEQAQAVAEVLNNQAIRVETNLENKPLGAKIREQSLQKTPYLCIIGDKEVQLSTEKEFFVSVRTRENKDLGQQKLSEFIKVLKQQIEKKT
ncbi:threonine--tRNA ligase [Candidatus Roizmanbacteria bacterium RIFOXYB2_FULL_41_10]|uniref:Threonine--tRNA ligase n=1 Tax=Candidatus Roizmanbacteria bacterium RIFOXYA1_FULL_41_12 TaxID=1802082 RepID=A0A1F7KEP4_9BACT|nr:MAG: threonine--tRNA ligase [Candidatus Roizmanbacteria bacterium RIFOXYA1_FULL_41_12]OGK69009.1 MAG: threonine--tRNA ligase [Candidatus Roizmanbacteria bacterium RIFOXYB2_FULL_41_10]OGK71535.1 MAG: threonine--tRNA ligase [Candidatus Roizmanbacteria bacterium RIFOXYC1_FULL_41_16]OGK75784.1 MAG: threonine--tRNA ligase [Candidatus Roizmanbacteria bacterium RIFOXYD1_FULL_41_24]